MGRKEKIVLPPELPPDIPEDDIDVSDEDLQFVNENLDYAGFVSSLDTKSITKHVSRVADAKEDDLEALYEKRLRKKSQQTKIEESGVLVDPVDALPLKTLDGQVHFRTVSKALATSDEGTGGNDKECGIVKLTKAERRAKLKKQKKEAKKQEKDVVETEQEPTPQAAILAEVKEDLTLEEAFENKKHKLADLGTTLLANPESNIKSLKEMIQISKDSDLAISKLGLLSLLAVFKDIIPGYRIRLPTEKELEMKVSKEVKKMRYYESTLLSAYKVYLQKLVTLEKQTLFQSLAIRCICTLLDAHPHFNFRESLLGVVVRNISSKNDAIRKLCCSTIKSLFTNEGKHGGVVTEEAVRLIADHVKAHNCQLHPDTVEVFLSLKFDDDLGKYEEAKKDNRVKRKRGRKRKNSEEPNRLPGNDRKKTRQETIAKMREEVTTEYKAASFTPDDMERKNIQSETLSAVFETYFRILKNAMEPIDASAEGNAGLSSATSSCHPLLAPCLKGLGKFSHLIDLDFMGDLMNHLKMLASAGKSIESSEKSSKCLNVSERLQCCIIAFKIMRSNLDALNVDLHDFFVQLFNLIHEYRPGRDHGQVLAEALKVMLCDERHSDMQKAAAFIKRLATSTLSFGSAECMAALVTVKHLLQKNVKCRNLLENDSGGGSVSGSIAKYQPYATDPNLSGALASVLWELSLLSKHYHPAISTLASSLAGMNAAQNQVYLTTQSPQQAFLDFSIDRETFQPPSDTMKPSKRKRLTDSSITTHVKPATLLEPLDEDHMKTRLRAHFTFMQGLQEQERLRDELDKTKSFIQLYEQYKQPKRKPAAKSKKKLKSSNA